MTLYAFVLTVKYVKELGGEVGATAPRCDAGAG